MTDEQKKAMANLLRTIKRNSETTAAALEEAANYLDPPSDLPEFSRSGHYS